MPNHLVRSISPGGPFVLEALSHHFNVDAEKCERNANEKIKGESEEKRREFKVIQGLAPQVVEISQRFFRVDFFVQIGDPLNPPRDIHLRQFSWRPLRPIVLPFSLSTPGRLEGRDVIF